MEKIGIVKESESEWSSPMVIVMKKDGGIRICVDFQKLNQLTEFDAYPMACIDDLLDAVGRAKYLTTLDLAKGYWQVSMHEDDQAKTAFSSPIGFATIYGHAIWFKRSFSNFLKTRGQAATRN